MESINPLKVRYAVRISWGHCQSDCLYIGTLLSMYLMVDKDDEDVDGEDDGDGNGNDDGDGEDDGDVPPSGVSSAVFCGFSIFNCE